MAREAQSAEANRQGKLVPRLRPVHAHGAGRRHGQHPQHDEQALEAMAARHGHPGKPGLALAEWLCRTADRIDPTRVRGPFHRLGGRRICAGSCEPMLAITTTSERTGRWAKMLRSLAGSSEPESLVHTRSLAGFVTTIDAFRDLTEAQFRQMTKSSRVEPATPSPVRPASALPRCPSLFQGSNRTPMADAVRRAAGPLPSRRTISRRSRS